jgi:hypothetical protein
VLGYEVEVKQVLDLCAVESPVGRSVGLKLAVDRPVQPLVDHLVLIGKGQAGERLGLFHCAVADEADTLRPSVRNTLRPSR